MSREKTSFRGSVSLKLIGPDRKVKFSTETKPNKYLEFLRTLLLFFLEGDYV